MNQLLLTLSYKIGHWIASSRKNKYIFIFDSFGIAYILDEIDRIYEDFNIITNICRIQDITSNKCGLFKIVFILRNVNCKDKFIEFSNLFDKNDFLENEIA